MHLLNSFMMWITGFIMSQESNFDILDLFYPRLRPSFQNRSLNEKIPIRRTAELLARNFGFDCEIHNVVTEDGYILGIHRIRKNGVEKKKLPVTLIVPGFLAGSDPWLFRGSDKDMPYILAENGYEVWIYNFRGNVYSRRHVNLNPNTDKKFWDFGYHQMSLYDLPAVIDYILKLTSQKSLSVTGHSMGAAIILATCSLKPQYNKKINLAILFAPAATIIPSSVNPLLKLLLSFVPYVGNFLVKRNTYEILPQRKINGKIGELICGNGFPSQKFCLSLLFQLVGENYEQFNTTLIPVAFSYYPTGTSTQTALQIREVYYGRFGYNKVINDNDENGTKKVHFIPYNLSKVVCPVVTFYGVNDQFVKLADLELLNKKLPIPMKLKKVSANKFNHLDFMWGTDAADLIYRPLLKLMNEYYSYRKI